MRGNLEGLRKFFTFLVNRHQDIIRYTFILLIVILISYLFPKYGKFRYEFEVGKPWKYETLFAPFDFGIQKSDVELQNEQEKLREEFAPYYRLDTLIVAQQKQSFAKQFNDKLALRRKLKSDTLPRVDSTRHMELGLAILEKFYTKGIISIESEDQANPGKLINVLKRDNIAEKKRLSDFYTIRDAYEEMRDITVNRRGIVEDFLDPLLEDAIKYNITYDKATTQKYLEEALSNISPTRGGVLESEKIIMEGDIVTEAKYQVLMSYKQEESNRTISDQKSRMIFIGNILLTLLVITIFVIFVRVFSPEVFFSNQKLFFVLAVITIMVGIVSSLVKTEINILYAIPFCIVPIIFRTFFGARLALHAHLTLVLLISFIVPLGIEYTFLQLVAGMVAIFTTIRAYYWSQFFASNAYILITYLVGFLATSLIQSGSMSEIKLANMGMLTLNVLLTLLAYPLIPVFEKLFGFVSEITLLELSDINKPLLKDLSLKAPGTFHHSLSVANLAEAATSEIGGNSLLVKVGALYHDVGKMDQPTYFIENQHADVNPHDDLPYEESARIIIGHVKKGVEKAKKTNLPDILIDFIRTHHGTTRVEYFYQSYIKNFPEEKISEEVFRYPGPLPYSKETAVLMMADSCEAASRSLKNPTNEDIDNLVERLVNNKIEQNQFVNADITFKEISIVKKVLKKMLHSMYHVRIAYPESKTKGMK